MDEDYTYYGTVAALALISLSFYVIDWGDYVQLKEEDIKDQKLAVVLINSNHPLSYKVKQILEQKGFAIYDICLSKEKQIAIEKTSISINLVNHDHIDKAAKFIKNKLDSSNQKLHAYLSLPVVYDGEANLNSLKQVLDEHLLPKFNLLKLVLNTNGGLETRVIHIQDAASLNPDLSKLIRSMESSMNKYLRKQGLQVGGNFFEVNVRESDAIEGLLMGALEALFEWGAGVLSRLHLAVERQLELRGSFSDCLIPGANINGSSTRDPISTDGCKLVNPNSSKREKINEKIVQIIERLVAQAHNGKRTLII